MFRLFTTRHFDRQLAAFKHAHPELGRRLADALRQLESDPFQPRLHLHPLKGDLEGLHAVSVTHSYRITLNLNAVQKKLVLLDIGSHDEVYR